ncbi:MAG: hypothetical protein ACFFB8_14535 [Promethearchaeota archaeon]
MAKITKKLKKRIIILLSTFILTLIISTIIFVEFNINIGYLLGFLFITTFVISIILTIFLRIEQGEKIIRHYRSNPNQPINKIARKVSTSDEKVAFKIAKLERKEWDPIKFKIQRAQKTLKENSNILREIFSLMNETGKEKHEVWIDHYYTMIIFRDKMLLQRNRRYQWIFDKSLQTFFLYKILFGFKRQKPIHFSKIESIIYRDKSDLSRPEMYHLLILLKNKEEIKLYVGRNDKCEKIGILISKFLEIPFKYDASQDTQFKIYWD